MTDTIKGTTMEARAQARYIRVTPMKARRVVDLIRGLPATEAQAVLRFAPPLHRDVRRLRTSLRESTSRLAVRSVEDLAG